MRPSRRFPPRPDRRPGLAGEVRIDGIFLAASFDRHQPPAAARCLLEDAEDGAAARSSTFMIRAV
jgi:hypothetical protein